MIGAQALPPLTWSIALGLDIWCGQFNIVDGNVYEEGPYVGVFEGTRHAADVGVYIVAEPVGAASAALCDTVVEAVARAFGSPEHALTANLLRAVGAGHQHVRDWNRLHGGNGAAGVGLSCLAVRNNEAYLAQCGPALAVAHAAGRYRVAAPTGDDSRRPLGLGDRAAPVFTRFTVGPGDVILLTFSAADRLIDRGTLISLVSAPPDEAMPALYVRSKSAQAFGALYVAMLEPEPPGAEHRGSGSASAPPAAPPPARPTGQPPPTARTSLASRPARAAPAPAATAAPAHTAPPPAPHHPSPNGTAHRRPAAPGTLGSGRSRVRSPNGVIRRGVALGALDGGHRLPGRRALALAGIGLLVVLFVWLALPALARRGNDDRYQALLRSADSAVADAGAEADLARRRTLLNRAEADLMEARALRPDAGAVADRLKRVADAVAAMDGTRELAGLTQIADLADAGIAPQTGIELAVVARVYLLDAATGKVLAFSGRPGERPETVFDEGRSAGPERTGKARHLLVAPDPTGKEGTLLVLDANRRLFALAPDGSWRPVALPGADSWKADTAITATVGALYVLDAPGERIWRYTGTAAGYEGQPEAVVSRPVLRTAVDLSVSSVPVAATNDGRLLRMLDGREEELRPAALDRPLSAPSAPLFNPADGMLYIADRGNRRIVVLDAAGQFRGQLVHRRLTALRAFALDEVHGAIYAVSGQSLMTAPLPH